MTTVAPPAAPVLAPPPAGVDGLSSASAAEQLDRDGPNRVVPETRSRRLRRIVGPLADPMVLLLLIAAPTYLIIGDTVDAIVTFVALVPVIAVGWLLEARAERTLEQLRRLTAPTATVWRDSHHIVIASEDLVVGDLVWLHEGDVAPADALVVSSTQLLIDESTLTGESLPVAKAADASGEEATVWAGTTVLAGRAVVRVVATGASTRYGRIGALVASVRQPATPLQRGLGRLVGTLAVVAAVFCVAVIAAELLHGNGWGQAVIAGVSLAIAAIPEEFSMIYTLYLALGAWRLAQQHVLVRRLPGVETLGSTTAICVDKTGTLTHGRLTLAGLATVDGVRHEGGTLQPTAQVLLEAALLACEPDPFDPLDLAIVAYAREHGVQVSALHAGKLVADWPFDPVDKYLTHLWQLPGGEHRVAAKGAMEGVLAHATTTPETRRLAEMANDAFAAAGMRVIAVAAGPAAGATGDRTDDEASLRFAGLVAFSDPVRDGVAEALEDCRNAGIRVIMITGDHPATAHAVAEALSLPHTNGGGDVIVTGADLDAASPDQLDELVASANVFARTRPEQKHQLVQALRRRGEVVAMTGDGINDAPALREADIGIAMGQRGTEVARESATLVLLDDNFATIVAAVRDGRRIFDNLMRAFGYLIAFHPPLLFGALVMPLVNQPLLLLPVHLIVLELLLHPVVSLVFQVDPADRDVMQRPPTPVAAALRLRAFWRPYAVGTVLAAGIVTEYLVALELGWPVEQARAIAFATLLASQPFLVLTSRSPDRPLWSSGRASTPTLQYVLAALVAFTVAVVHVPPLADLLQLSPFPFAAWSIVLAVAAVTTLWAEPLKRQAGHGTSDATHARENPRSRHQDDPCEAVPKLRVANSNEQRNGASHADRR